MAAPALAMLSLSERIGSELERSTLEQIDGYVILMSVSKDAVLTALARERARLGLKKFDMHRVT